MLDVLEEHEGTVSIAGRTITNLRFEDDIDGLAGSKQELAQLIERIDQTSKAYGMEINAETTKLITNNINGIHKEIKASDQTFQTVTNFKYRGTVISDAGSKAEMLSRIAQCTTTMTKYGTIRISRSDPKSDYCAPSSYPSVLPRPFLQGATPCPFLVTPCLF